MADMPDDKARLIPLSGAYNIRDLGGYRTRAGGMTRNRRVFRADSPHRLTSEDLDLLLHSGLETVIDLRAAHERKDAPNPLERIGDVDYLHLPLFDALAPSHVHEGTTSADPLPEFYARTLETRAGPVRDVLQAIGEARPGVVLFHCTAGKDRTGLIAALLLANAGVRDEEIVADYARTAALISPMVAEFLDRARGNGTDVEAYKRVLKARPETMQRVLADIAQRYGSVPAYLDQIGITPGQRRKLEDRLLAAALIV